MCAIYIIKSSNLNDIPRVTKYKRSGDVFNGESTLHEMNSRRNNITMLQLMLPRILRSKVSRHKRTMLFTRLSFTFKECFCLKCWAGTRAPEIPNLHLLRGLGYYDNVRTGM